MQNAAVLKRRTRKKRSRGKGGKCEELPEKIKGTRKIQENDQSDLRLTTPHREAENTSFGVAKRNWGGKRGRRVGGGSLERQGSLNRMNFPTG